MTRRIVWIGVIVAALLALGFLGFINFFEEVPVKRHTPPEAEARRNPYLAFERFMLRMGRPLERQNDARQLDHLPPGSIVILDEQRRAHMTAERLDRLLAWVHGGGYLIVAPESGTRDDPILKAFQLSRFERAAANATPPSAPTRDDEDEEEDSGPKADGKQCPAPTAPPARQPGDLCAPTPAKQPPPQRYSLQIPGSPRTLVADYSGTGLCTDQIAPAWAAGAPGFGAQILHFRHGAGQVTFVNHLRGLLNNWRIGEHDHAELIWSLIEQQAPGQNTRVTFVTRLSVPTLFEWLAESAWAALIAGAALLLLWLWRVVPRFGPPRPEAAPERRQLREHLAALGRYVWRLDGLDHWLAIARENFLQRLALRHPALAALPPGEQASALARLTGRSASMIAAALHGPAGSTTNFTVALRTLKNLERSL